MALRYFLKEFLQNGRWLGGLNIIRKIDTAGTAARRPGSSRKRTVRAVDYINHVEAQNLRNLF